MKTRKKKRVYDTMPRVRAVSVSGAARLVTLEDPNADATPARDAFARLRPPEGTSPDAVSSWRAVVEKVARAVKVLPSLHADDVPAASTRVGEGEEPGTIREEATALAAETGNPDVVSLVGRLLDEVGV
jgi:hypothetical protein